MELQDRVTIMTGNVRKCNHVQQLINVQTSDELATVLKCTLKCWRKEHGEEAAIQAEIMGHPKLMEGVPQEERHDSQITAKLFLLNGITDPDYAVKNINTVLQAMNVDAIDTLIVSQDNIPAGPLPRNFLDVYKKVEEFQQKGVIKTIGVADLSEDMILELFTNVDVKPGVLQVNYAQNCCEANSQMMDFAKTHNMELLTHSDDTIITTESFSKITQRYNIASEAGTQWNPQTVVRYSVVDVPRSVLKNVGYVVSASRPV